ncbi:Bug family tripartite tricarboxylate transporter substrate binding protein [Ramlibacter sp. Leaf400]|uniref:Bug family tripartite tricarboxylate transporter substrate binding protein n=1 Tax=Ramlibacter sp. Leaf400 TaxID=1736365 RepID=UPI0006F4AE31|nr:Bug family tripartite tricarboxylate transporter substrate binding protein [Ramlibacter sp. Leaf400]KQT12265.1 twin-arginine translocation pathway signal protein [Ramlibacter sp. Leaf400]
MTFDRRQFIQATAAVLAAGGAVVPAYAQTPDTARVVIGFAPGGTIDLAGRRIAEKLQPSFAKAVIVDNRTGAGGQIAAQGVKSAAPDGTAMLLTPTSPMSLHLFTYKKLPYDPVADFTPVSGAVMFDYSLAVGPLVPASVRSVKDFLAWCKANPAHANFGSAGQGSAAHFIGAALGRMGDADLRHIAFRGSQPALADMIGGQIAAVVGPTGEFMPNVKAGKIRLLASSGPKRGKFTPDTPTMAEQGFKDLAYVGWFGFFVPARTPADVVQRLNGGIRQALAQQDVVDSLATAYMEPLPTAPAQMAQMLKTETEFWAGLVKTVGFSVE